MCKIIQFISLLISNGLKWLKKQIRLYGVNPRFSQLEPKIFKFAFFLIRDYLLNPLSSLFLYIMLLSLVFFYFSKLLFLGFLQLKAYLVHGQNTVK